MRLLLDETLPDELAQRLQLQQHDVATVATNPELRGACDRDVFAIARREGRVLVTTNAIDFLVLAGAQEHPGLVVTTVRRIAPDALAQFVRDLQRLASDFGGGRPVTRLIT